MTNFQIADVNLALDRIFVHHLLQWEVMFVLSIFAMLLYLEQASFRVYFQKLNYLKTCLLGQQYQQPSVQSWTN